MTKFITKRPPHSERLAIDDRLLHFRCPADVRERFIEVCEQTGGQDHRKVLLFLVFRVVRYQSYLPVVPLDTYSGDSPIPWQKLVLNYKVQAKFLRQCAIRRITVHDVIYTQMLAFIKKHS